MPVIAGARERLSERPAEAKNPLCLSDMPRRGVSGDRVLWAFGSATWRPFFVGVFWIHENGWHGCVRSLSSLRGCSATLAVDRLDAENIWRLYPRHLPWRGGTDDAN